MTDGLAGLGYTVEEEFNKGKFILKNKVLFSDLLSGKSTELIESDLAFQNEQAIYQFKFIKPEVERKEIVQCGVSVLEDRGNHIGAKKTELRTRNLLTSVNNTKKIIEEADIFFNNLDVYKELEEPMARKILIHSPPGMGKTATITQYSMHAIAEDPGTVVLLWPTSQIDSASVMDFLGKHSDYAKEATRMIFVVEDIGGGEREGSYGSRQVDSALLDLLDGLQISFKLPTLIIATTNYPQNLLSALADRPGRFDLIMDLQAPSYQEKVDLLEWIAKRKFTDEEKAVFKNSLTDEFSVAHLKEVVIRSKLHKKSIGKVVQELIDHREKFNSGFEKEGKGRMGFSNKFED
jgi:AAA+ superfamily predicted ATPase